MKKICLSAIIFCFIFPAFFNNENISFAANSPIYAKIDSSETFMYSSPDDIEKNKLFVLPKSFFVKLLNKANANFYYCTYKDLNGYVKQKDVVPMKGTPIHPYMEGLFRIIALEGLGIYSAPKSNSKNLLATIPYLTDDLIYYGLLLGDDLVPGNTNQWIYCKYNEDNGLNGYVYSTFCDKLPKQDLNTEYYEIIENPFDSSVKPTALSPVAMGFIIIGVAIPCLIVLFLLIKPTLIKEKLNSPKPTLRAKGKRDYFEFDESDLN